MLTAAASSSTRGYTTGTASTRSAAARATTRAWGCTAIRRATSSTGRMRVSSCPFTRLPHRPLPKAASSSARRSSNALRRGNTSCGFTSNCGGTATPVLFRALPWPTARPAPSPSCAPGESIPASGRSTCRRRSATSASHRRCPCSSRAAIGKATIASPFCGAISPAGRWPAI